VSKLAKVCKEGSLPSIIGNQRIARTPQTSSRLALENGTRRIRIWIKGRDTLPRFFGAASPDWIRGFSEELLERPSRIRLRSLKDKAIEGEGENQERSQGNRRPTRRTKTFNALCRYFLNRFGWIRFDNLDD
jgi:hypothetical protein